MRVAILDAAWERACHTPWAQVRIAEVASEVGVSRQTIYNEFGTKEQLAEALFARALDEFLVGVEEILDGQPQFDLALDAAMTWMLHQAHDHPLLTRVMADARSGAALVPILTVRADSIIRPVREQLVEMCVARWPHVEVGSALVVADLFVRFVLSQILVPTDLDQDAVVDNLVRMAAHLQHGGDAVDGRA
jgi:AcrR family transcriptional regulator